MAFEAILAHPDTKPRRWRRGMLTISLALHVAALSIVLVRSQWTVDEMAMPAIEVKLSEAPPPPPPPPPPAGSKKPTNSVKPKIKVPTKPEIVQPKETPKEEPKPEEHQDEGEDQGQVGGEKGGVAGGVVGGVVGADAPPPPKPSGPEMLSAREGGQLLLSNTSVPPYCCPKIPRALENVDSFTASLRVCVAPDGSVYDVRVLTGASPAIDSQIPTFVRRWRYRPRMSAEGRPIAFCYPLRYEITQN